MPAREEAVEIAPESIPEIVDKFDVLKDALETKHGWFFVGEVGCDYWFSILSTAAFKTMYVFDETMVPGRLSIVHRQRVPASK